MQLQRKPGESHREQVGHFGEVAIVKVATELADTPDAAKYLPHVELIGDHDGGQTSGILHLPGDERFLNEDDAIFALDGLVHNAFKTLEAQHRNS